MTMIRKGLLAAGLMLGATSLAAAAPAMVSADLNLRAGPGTGHGVLTVLPAGATVDTLGCTGNWCRISYRGMTGYASASYLQGGVYAAAPRRASPAAPFVAGAAVGALAGAAIAGPRYYGPRHHWRYHRGYSRGPGWGRPYRRW